MNKNLTTLLALGVLALPLTVSLKAAEDPNAAAEKRLRDTLRNTMLQLRTAQTEQAALQATQLELEEKNKELTKKTEDLAKELAALKKKSDADKDAAEATVTTLTGKLTEQEKRGAQLDEALEKWKQGYAKAVDVAKAKEADRAVAVSKAVLLERRVAVRDVKNAEMFKLASEILKRYESFGLGTALTAREPFVGISRVKMQNIVQDYQEKLVGQKIKSSDDNPPPPPVRKDSEAAQKTATPAEKPKAAEPAKEKPGQKAKV